MKINVAAILFGLAVLAPLAAVAKPTTPPRPRTIAVHDHTPKVRTRTLAPHK